jgi:uncharacterized membrane protein
VISPISVDSTSLISEKTAWQAGRVSTVWAPLWAWSTLTVLAHSGGQRGAAGEKALGIGRVDV